MREYRPSASFMCKALYGKGYTFIYDDLDYRYFVDYAFFWHITTYAVKAGNIYLVILPNRKPNLVRRYIDPDYETPYPEKYIYLGESCNDCLCSRCRMLDHCNIIDRRTDFHCRSYCKGKRKPVGRCWQHEPVRRMRLGTASWSTD